MRRKKRKSKINPIVAAATGLVICSMFGMPAIIPVPIEEDCEHEFLLVKRGIWPFDCMYLVCKKCGKNKKVKRNE